RNAAASSIARTVASSSSRPLPAGSGHTIGPPQATTRTGPSTPGAPGAAAPAGAAAAEAAGGIPASRCEARRRGSVADGRRGCSGLSTPPSGGGGGGGRRGAGGGGGGAGG